MAVAGRVRETRTEVPPPGEDTAPAQGPRVSARRLAAPAVPVLLGWLAVSTWFRPGRFVAAGDIAPFVRTGFRGELFELWNHRVSGAGSATSIVGHSFEVALLTVTTRLGLPAHGAQQILFSVAVGLAMAGAMYFVSAFTRRPLVTVTAGLVAVFNPLSVSLLPNPLPLVGVGTAGLLGGLVFRAAAGGRPPWWATAVALLPASYLSLNPPLLAVLPVWVLALLGPAGVLHGARGARRGVRFLLRSLPVALLVNLWWIVPTGLTLLGSRGAVDTIAVTDVSQWAWTHARSSVANVMTLTATWTWDHPEYAPWSTTLDAPAFAWLRYGLPVAALAAPLVGSARRRRIAVVFLPLVLVSVLLIKGVHGPVAGLNRALYAHVPAYWLFREPVGKIGVVLVVLYSLLAGLTLQAVWEWLRAHTGRAASAGGVVLFLCVPLASAYPLLDGSVIAGARPPLPGAHVRVPDGWYRLADRMNGDPSVDKVLVLPLGDFYQMPTTWGFYGTDAIPGQFLTDPVIQQSASGYFSVPTDFAALVARSQAALLAGETGLARRLFGEMAVTHVVLRRDYDRSFPGRDIADPDALRSPLERLARERSDFGVASVYTVGSPARVTLRTNGADVALPWSSRGPGEYTVRLPGRAEGTLVLREGYSRNWRLTGAAGSHGPALGYANGWEVRTAEPETVTLSHGPSRLARRSLQLSVGGAGVVALAAGVLRVRARRRGPPASRPPGAAPAT